MPKSQRTTNPESPVAKIVTLNDLLTSIKADDAKRRAERKQKTHEAHKAAMLAFCDYASLVGRKEASRELALFAQIASAIP